MINIGKYIEMAINWLTEDLSTVFSMYCSGYRFI